LTISDKEINKKEYFYYEISCPLSYFISNEFIELLNDSAYVLSSNARIDTDCVFAVVSGKLILNVNQDLYQRLGLTGTKSLINPTRRIITIDLNEKISDRITWCFSNTCTEAFTFYISSWDTIAKKSRDIIFPSFVQSIRKELSYESKLLKECLVPDMDTVIEDDNQRIMDYMEWIGMAGIHSPRYTLLTRLKKGHTVDPFICLYTLPEPHTYANIQVSKFKGFLIPEFISLLKSEKYS
jgi:hypothetical protein